MCFDSWIFTPYFYTLNTKGMNHLKITFIATRYGLDGPGIESRWGEIFHTRPDQPCVPPNLLYNEYRVFPVDKAAILFYLYYYIFRISDQVTSNDELDKVSNRRS
jgi:hypothetical protein